MINFPLRWHPQYAHHDLSAMGVLLIGERDEFFIAVEEYQALSHAVSMEGHLSDYVFAAADTLTQVNRLKQVDQWVADGILQQEERADKFTVPDFNLPVMADVCNHHRVYCLSSLMAEHELNRVYSHLSLLTTPLVVVIVDDYLDPRLLSLNAQLKTEQKDWLLLKITGAEHRVGPYFRTTDDSQSCYQCLYDRLVQNKPVREWYRRYDDAEFHHPVPVWFDANASMASLDLLQEDLLKILQQKASGFYQWLPAQTDSQRWHPVIRRPQCSCCGHPDAFQQLNAEPFHLKEVTRIADDDGGYRALTREQTLALIEPLIDPVTGIISDLQKISEEDSHGTLAIYRAAYFQNSFQKAELSADTFVQLSLGKGVANDQARSSALGEALERQAAQYRGEEPIIYGKPDELPNRACVPQMLSPFSEQQYEAFRYLTGVSLQQPQWVKRYEPGIAMHWATGWSLTHSEPVLFPAAYCFANTPFEDHVYSLYNHNGNAAGSSVEEAILQGTFEVIERDAAAIWWYNQIPRPEIDASLITPSQKKIIDQTLHPHWQYWLLDISHDIGVVSCVAVGRHEQTGQFVLGFGAHTEPSIACTRALTEMYQLIVVKDKVTGPFDFNAIEALPFLFPRRNSQKRMGEDFASVQGQSIRDAILFLQEELKKIGLEYCVVRYSRPDIPLQTVKVIVPGLCHFWPQMASQRLYDVPVKLGWLSKPLAENEMNPIALYL